MALNLTMEDITIPLSSVFIDPHFIQQMGAKWCSKGSIRYNMQLILEGGSSRQLGFVYRDSLTTAERCDRGKAKHGKAVNEPDSEGIKSKDTHYLQVRNIVEHD